MKRRVVWVGRSEERAKDLAAALTKAGLESFVRPAIRITDEFDDSAFQAFIQNPQKYDLAVFVSAEAARRAIGALRNIAQSPTTLPPALAIGEATGRELTEWFHLAEKPDAVGSSEFLLNSPILSKVAGQKIAVLGGTSNSKAHTLSPLLYSALTARGAQVFPLSSYRRKPAPPDDGAIAKLLGDNALAATVAYSGDALRHMKAMNGAIVSLPLFVIHPHLLHAAQKAGFSHPIVGPAAAEAMAKIIAQEISRSTV
ncbi:MAG: uroporphyrinogen-III synthase [Candidatus Zeuxoniibacter abyssi]|nr:MAG: uroporphyrinogen-III synthase [Candidatus Persebacteraceae bacterium AB1(2)]